MGRTVAITGAGSGIGRAIAQAFADNGDRVYACDISRERLDETLAGLGDSAQGDTVDVTDYERLQDFLRRADEDGGLGVVVNNAGVFDGYAAIEETSKELWDRIIEIDLTGCFYGCKIAAELMAPRGWGRIVSVGSIASFRGGPDGLAYTAAKAGMLGLTRRLAFDVGRSGITANVICPGTIATDIRANSAEILAETSVDMDRGVSASFSQEMLDYLIPMRRRGTPDEVASLAVFLASDGAGYITGESIAVDGGWLSV
jgi:NAD(P)-dependent dehydrogenase (short-subunit alcohol dehydrogenase family)